MGVTQRLFAAVFFAADINKCLFFRLFLSLNGDVIIPAQGRIQPQFVIISSTFLRLGQGRGNRVDGRAVIASGVLLAQGGDCLVDFLNASGRFDAQDAVIIVYRSHKIFLEESWRTP